MQSTEIINIFGNTMPITDSHCHINLIHQQDSNKAAALLAVHDFDLKILDVGIAPNDWSTRLELCKHTKNMYHSAGLHPSRYAEYTGNALLDELEPLVPQAVAVGETGLDWYRMYAEKPLQIELFEIQIGLAKKYQKPLIIHARESIDDVIHILASKHISATDSVGIMHCFSGNEAQAKRCLDLGLYISFGANISYQSAENLRNVVKYIPSEKLLTETDAPYLPHRKIQKQAKKKRYNRVNTPLYLYYLYETLAEIRNTSIEDIAYLARTNLDSFLQ